MTLPTTQEFYYREGPPPYFSSSDRYQYPPSQIYVTSAPEKLTPEDVIEFKEIASRFVSFSYEEIEEDIMAAFREYRGDMETENEIRKLVVRKEIMARRIGFSNLFRIDIERIYYFPSEHCYYQVIVPRHYFREENSPSFKRLVKRVPYKDIFRINILT